MRQSIIRVCVCARVFPPFPSTLNKGGRVGGDKGEERRERERKERRGLEIHGWRKGLHETEGRCATSGERPGIIKTATRRVVCERRQTPC